jgi:short-subunit dehydrogenase
MFQEAPVQVASKFQEAAKAGAYHVNSERIIIQPTYLSTVSTSVSQLNYSQTIPRFRSKNIVDYHYIQNGELYRLSSPLF